MFNESIAECERMYQNQLSILKTEMDDKIKKIETYYQEEIKNVNENRAKI